MLISILIPWLSQNPSIKLKETERNKVSKGLTGQQTIQMESGGTRWNRENKRKELLLDATWDPGWAWLKLFLCRLRLSLFLLPCFSWNMLFGKLQSTSRCRSISLHFPYSGNSAWFQLSGTRHTLFVHLTHHLLQQKYKNNVYMRCKHLPQTSAHLLLDTTSTGSSYF